MWTFYNHFCCCCREVFIKPNCNNFYSNPVNFHFNSLYLVYLPQINSVFKQTFQTEMKAVTDQKETNQKGTQK